MPRKSHTPRAAATDRLPPHAIEAEQAALSCLLLDPLESVNECEEAGVTVEWFYDLRHQLILASMQALVKDRGGIDLVTLHQHLKDQQNLEQIGGDAYLAALADLVPSAANLPHYLEILRGKWTARRLLSTCAKAVSAVYEDEQQIETAVNEAQREVLALSQDRAGASETKLRQVVPDLLYDLEEYHRGHAQIRGLTTGLEYVDKLLCGLGGTQGNYIVISARPGLGKTSLATQIAMHAALDFVAWEPVFEPGPAGPVPVMEESETGPRQKMKPRKGVPVAIFTLEMVTKALVHRMLFQRAGADMQRWRTGFADANDYPRLTAAASELTHCDNLVIDDAGRCTIDTLKAKARRMFRQYGVKLFVIDYIQLMRAGGRRFREDRVQELSEISGEIQSLGKELDVPIIVLAQMNRDYEKDPNRAPRLSDLKDCGSIEQDADLVGFLYRPKLKGDKEAQYENAMREVYGHDWSKYPMRVDCLWAKNRFGPCGNSQLLFQRSSTRFVDWNVWLKQHGQKEPAAGERQYASAETEGREPMPTNEELNV